MTPPRPRHEPSTDTRPLDQLGLPPAVCALLAPWVGNMGVSPPGPTVAVEKNGLRVELEFQGEGWGGDYDPHDPGDTPLLQFTCFARTADSGEPFELEGTSWRTCINANASWEVRVALAASILKEVSRPLAFRPGREIAADWGCRAGSVCENLGALGDDMPDFQALAQLVPSAKAQHALDQALPPATASTSGLRM